MNKFIAEFIGTLVLVYVILATGQPFYLMIKVTPTPCPLTNYPLSAVKVTLSQNIFLLVEK